MVSITLRWQASPVEEAVTSYRVYMDNVLVSDSTSTEFSMNIEPGKHSFAVAAKNLYGEGPRSDEVFTPSPCGKIVSVSIVVNVT